MAVFTPTPNVALATFIFIGPQLQTMTMNTHWALGDPKPMTETDVLSLATLLAPQFGVDFGGLFTDKVLFQACHVRALDAADAPQSTDASHPAAGSASGTALPMEVAALTRFIAAVPGRTHRNRAYLPGLTTGWLDSASTGLLQASKVSDLNRAWATMASAAAENDPAFVQVVVSKKTHTYLTVSSFQTQSRPASQRRRQP